MEMKKLLLLFILIILTSTTMLRCCSSKGTPIVIDTDAYKYVEQFKKDAEFFGVDFKAVKDSIDSVVFYPLYPGFYGLYAPLNRQIVINYVYAKDSLIMKRIVYHELGHLYGLPHDTGGIMGTGVSEKMIRTIYSNPQVWDIHKAYLFFMIKKHLDKSK